MKNMQIFIVFIIGAVLIAIGVGCKIMEYSPAASSFFLIVGMTFNAIALVLMILKLFKKNKPGSFLDS